jgi:hypothetical protein
MYNQTSHTVFFQSLLEVDRAFAMKTKAAGCPACGGKLDVRNYQRKPRGVSGISGDEEMRFSFCCRQEGCRKSVMPQSVRFLGRKVYSSLVVILSAISELWAEAKFEICRQTFARWQVFWRRVLSPLGVFYKSKINLFKAGFSFSLSEIFGVYRNVTPDLERTWHRVLEFFADLSASGASITI